MLFCLFVVRNYSLQNHDVMKNLHYYIDYERQQDEQFAKRVERVLKKNISNSDFTVDEFCNLVFMSRSCLHRNLKKLTGFSTTELLRQYRIRVAAEMMGKSSANILEISQKVGFYDYCYFSKCFKKIMKKTPKEYLADKKEQRLSRILQYVARTSQQCS